jgi:hypothetical protein
MKYLIVALTLISSTALGQDYLLDRAGGERLTTPDGQFLLAQEPAGGKVHSVMQLSTWGGPGGTFISLNADVQEDLRAIKLLAHVVDGDKAIRFVWLYLNDQVVATCPGRSCDYLMPVDKMHDGVNEILTAYQPDTGAARGTSFKISKP